MLEEEDLKNRVGDMSCNICFSSFVSGLPLSEKQVYASSCCSTCFKLALAVLLASIASVHGMTTHMLAKLSLHLVIY